MGGTSHQEQRTQSQTKNEPYYMAKPGLEQTANFLAPQWANVGATGNEQAAFAGLEANAQAGNPYAENIGLLANDLLGGGKDRTGMVQSNFDQFKGGLLPYTTMSTDPYQNDAFTKYANQLSTDALNAVKGQYAAAGYDPSAMTFGKSVAEGVGRAVAPIWAQERNNLEAQKMGAINSLYQGGNTTAGLLSGLDQAALGNRQAGVDVARTALSAKDSPLTRMLDVEQMRRQLPIGNIANLENLILPIAQVGGTSYTDSYSQGSKTASPVETALGWTKAATNLFGGGGASSGVKGWF